MAYPGGGAWGARAPGVSGLKKRKEGEKEGKRERKKEKWRREGSDGDDLKNPACSLKY